ncbi:MAG TPA: hypothetical protein VIG30_09845 [Ktedonobacterales bacterium]
MGTLAHVFEAEGLSTVMIASMRSQVERLHPPRALFCDFPLGRPLGKPGDPAFQRRVLDAAFALLGANAGPVLATFPEVISDQAEEALACDLPPRFDPSLPPAVDEAKGLRAAYERQRAATGRTLVGRGVVDATQVPDAVLAFVRIAGGEPWEEVWRQTGYTADPPQVQSDVRAYYEEAAAALADHVPAARAAESWFYHHTAAGAVMRQAQHALREAGYRWWYFFLPATQSDEPPPG